MGGIYWLASYHRSGNTWFRVWLANLRAEDDAPVNINALDPAVACSRAWLSATLGFETADLDFDEIDLLRPTAYDWRPDDTVVSYQKVHDAYTRLADGSPVLGRAATLGAIYIVRNPLDVVPSYASHSGRTIDRAIALMGDPNHRHSARTDRLAMQMREKLLDWSGHVKSWVDAEGLAVHLVRYEDMSADPHGTLARAARFLGLPNDPARIARAVRNSSFDRLRAQEREFGFEGRSPGTPFFRRGLVGGWRDTLSEEQVARIIGDHGAVMRRFGYLDAHGNPA